MRTFLTHAFKVLALLLVSHLPSFGQLVVYTDRAAWEAALQGVVTEGLESVAANVDLMVTPTTVGTHRFTGSGSGSVVINLPPSGLFSNTTQINMWGTTGGTPRTTVSDIPTSYGIGFDWKTSAGSTGSHNSLYLSVTGTSGSLTRLLNPFPNVPQTGFIGIISPCGGITQYEAYSTRANFQNFSLDNFSYATNLAGGGLPEIDVQGNGMSIVANGNTPNTSNHTDFGTTQVAGGTIIRTFTVQNTGLANLVVSSIIAQSNSPQSDFAIGTLTPASPVPPGMSATFTVTFDPSAGGTSSTDIVVNNSDCDEAVYSFAVKGTGSQCQDLDGDGFNDASCGGTDCADNDNTVYPGATDICDGKDNDCDGTTDEGGTGAAPGWGVGVIGGATNTNSSFTCNSGTSSGTAFGLTSQGFSGAANADLINSNYQQRCGDASITARIASNPAPGWAGIYIRESLAPGSKMVALKTNLSSFLRREVRATTGGNKTTAQTALYSSYTWVRIVRTGNNFVFYTSPNGTTWFTYGSTTITMNSCVYLGVFAESINAATTINVSFDNVAITGGAAPLVTAPGQGFEAQEEYSPVMEQINVYPNPSTGQIQIGLQDFSGKAVRIKVSNSFGSTVLTTKLEEALDTESLDLSAFAPGVYWLQVQVEGYAPQVQKIILNR